jgi:hypothetical protein
MAEQLEDWEKRNLELYWSVAVHEMPAHMIDSGNLVCLFRCPPDIAIEKIKTGFADTFIRMETLPLSNKHCQIAAIWVKEIRLPMAAPTHVFILRADSRPGNNSRLLICHWRGYRKANEILPTLSSTIRFLLSRGVICTADEIMQDIIARVDNRVFKGKPINFRTIALAYAQRQLINHNLLEDDKVTLLDPHYTGVVLWRDWKENNEVLWTIECRLSAVIKPDGKSMLFAQIKASNAFVLETPIGLSLAYMLREDTYGLIEEIERQGWLEPYNLPVIEQQPESIELPDPEPGDKAPGQPVSPETVRKYHHLAKTTTLSANEINQKLHTDRRTYYQHCENYTGEEPIVMSNRAQLIKKNNWPPKRSEGVRE